MATEPTATKAELRRLIDAHVQAAVEQSWSGGTGDAADIPTAELNAVRAEDALNKFIDKAIITLPDFTF